LVHFFTKILCISCTGFFFVAKWWKFALKKESCWFACIGICEIMKYKFVIMCMFNTCNLLFSLQHIK
jgi:hypothetical protein